LLSKLRSRLRRALVRRLRAPDMPMSLERIRDLGFAPGLVFDVGAFQGDFALMTLGIWPSARVACFEPISHRSARIETLSRADRRIDLYRTLVGADEKEDVDLHVAESSTSLLRTPDTDKFPVERLPMTTLDRCIERHYAGRAPDLLKLDVQGYELEVLKGAERALRPGGVRAIVAEVNLLDLYEDVPLLDTLVPWLSARGFVAYDICGLIHRPLDGALWQCDMIFVRRDDPLRQDKGYFRV
jgi:FkbM family methyltransferase